jgi:diguanylate cyclase (GGDEF)-like protein/PAS domain S-box-containing protein
MEAALSFKFIPQETIRMHFMRHLWSTVRRGDAWLGAMLVALGLTTIAGWTLHVTAMVEIVHGLVPMVFNTGFCFLLSGTGFLLADPDGRRLRWLRTGIGLFLVILCGLTFVEHVWDRNMGIDMAFMHSWYDYGNTRPGRMAPNTAAGFMVIGLVYLFSHRVTTKLTATMVVMLTFCVLAIGLTGLVGYLLAPDLLFGWARSARMALHTASGMIVCAIGLWLWWSRSHWYSQEEFFGEDAKIRILSACILMIVTITVGLTSFVLLQGVLEKTLERRLEAVVYQRGPWFRTTTSEAANQAYAAVRFAGLKEPVKALLLDANDTSALIQFEAGARRLLEEGYRGLTIEDMTGKVVRSLGSLEQAAPFQIPLKKDGSLVLTWDEDPMIHIRQPIFSNNEKQIGNLRLDKSALLLLKPLFDLELLGNSVELAACILHPGELLCLPNNKNDSLFYIKLKGEQAAKLPMQLALAGKTGVVYSIDYRKKNVLAAYGELVPGLGFVAKQDTKEAYEAIRAALGVGVPLILIVSVMGALLLYSQLNPLIIRMRRSEQEADDAALETRTIMSAVGDGIITISNENTIQSINDAACSIFGYRSEELIGKNVSMLMPTELWRGQIVSAFEMAKAGPKLGRVSSNMQVESIKKDGSSFPLEVNINAVPGSGRELFVGVMRDITERKKTEETLFRLAQYDNLTGLPNRALFIDRLNNALIRSRRSGNAMALLFIDLDCFKEINDTHGHQGGDTLLTQVAGRLLSAVRESDTVARLAGDEFTIVLEELVDAYADSKSIAEKIVRLIRAPFNIEHRDIHITVSIGMITHDPGSGEIDVNNLMNRADKCMYAAKRAGKNQFCSE